MRINSPELWFLQPSWMAFMMKRGTSLTSWNGSGSFTGAEEMQEGVFTGDFTSSLWSLSRSLWLLRADEQCTGLSSASGSFSEPLGLEVTCSPNGMIWERIIPLINQVGHVWSYLLRHHSTFHTGNVLEKVTSRLWHGYPTLIQTCSAQKDEQKMWRMSFGKARSVSWFKVDR